MATTQHLHTIQEIYIAFYQRPADSAGLVYWAEQLAESAGNLNLIINAFANSPESQSLYGIINTSTISGVVDAIYQACFNRAPDAGGKSWYIDEFNAGRITPGQIAYAVLSGAQNDDVATIANKLAVADRFTDLVDGHDRSDPEFGSLQGAATYAGDDDAEAAREMLSQVGADSASRLSDAELEHFISTEIADPGDSILGTDGHEYRLTSSADIISGTAGNDLIDARPDSSGASTLGPDDIIDGGAGRDTLLLLNESGLTEGLQISSIETLELESLNGLLNVDQAGNSVDEVRVTGELGSSAIIGMFNNGSFFSAAAGVAAFFPTDATPPDQFDHLRIDTDIPGAGTFILLPRGIESISYQQQNAIDSGASTNLFIIESEHVNHLSLLKLGNNQGNTLTAYALPNTLRHIDASAADGEISLSILGSLAPISIHGGMGNGILQGGDGQDFISGGTGNDAITGDTYSIFEIGDGTVTSQQNSILIADEKAGDQFSVLIDGQLFSVRSNGTDALAQLAAAIDTSGLIGSAFIAEDSLKLVGKADGSAFHVAVGVTRADSTADNIDQGISLAMDAAPQQATAQAIFGPANADILAGGGGYNNFLFLSGSNGFDGEQFTSMDTITDLKLDFTEDTGDLITLNKNNFVVFDASSVLNDGQTQEMSGNSLANAVLALFDAGGALADASNQAGLFSFEGDNYLIIANTSIGFDAEDVIIRVTGYSGILDSSNLMIF